VTLARDQSGGTGATGASDGNEPQQEIARLRELLTVAESAIRSLQDRCEDLEEYRAHLGRLCVAGAQLHESDEPAESLRNLQDVLVNLLGSEQIAIWSLSADGRCLELRTSLGIDSEPWRTVKVGEGLVGKVAASGDIGYGPTAPGEPSLCIPLCLGRRVVGAVAVFQLLSHRSGFGPLDQDVFRLISRQAAFPLCCAGGPWHAARRAANGQS
jgi:hypothetical protein